LGDTVSGEGAEDDGVVTFGMMLEDRSPILANADGTTPAVRETNIAQSRMESEDAAFKVGE
jgi:hypothetical protein